MDATARIKEYALEKGAQLVGIAPVALFQIDVDARKPKAIVEGQKDICHGKIAADETDHHLDVAHLLRLDHAGHTHIGHARDGCTNHGNRYHPPGALAIATIEGFGVAVMSAGCPPAYAEHHQEVKDDDA